MVVLELLYEKHQDWLGIVKSFGCNPDTAEDIVMEMYIKMQKEIDKGRDIMYGDEINYYFIYLTLKNMFLDLKKKEQRVSFCDVDEVQLTIDKNPNFEGVYEMVQDELQEFHWFDQEVYKIIEGGRSIQSLADQTKISYRTLWHSYTKVKKKIKKKLNL